MNFLINCLLLLTGYAASANSMMEGLYCGKENCYEVLGLRRDTTKSELAKAYRKLARQWHPDMAKTKKDKETATEMFQTIANAYEILKDDDTRTDYDYMLDNPDKYYYHYYKYYRTRVTVDVRLVIAVTITVISVIQYISARNKYNMAISYLMTVPKYRVPALDMARQEGLLEDKRKRDRTKTKEEIKEEEDAVLRKVLENNMDMRGGYTKPSIYNVLWVQLLFSPYYLFQYVAWYARWVWKFTIHKEELGDEEKMYLIRKYLGKSETDWKALEDFEREKLMQKELWIREKFLAWRAEQEEEMKTKMAQNSRYKMYRRYIKKGGPGQMSFGPD